MLYLFQSIRKWYMNPIQVPEIPQIIQNLSNRVEAHHIAESTLNALIEGPLQDLTPSNSWKA